MSETLVVGSIAVDAFGGHSFFELAFSSLHSFVKKIEEYLFNAASKKTAAKTQKTKKKKSNTKNVQKPRKSPDGKRKHNWIRWTLVFILFVSIIAYAVIFAAIKYQTVSKYEDRSALPPNSEIGGIDVSDFEPDQVNRAISDKLSELQITIRSDEIDQDSKTYSPEELGVSVDIPAATREIRAQQELGSWRERIEIDRPKSAELAFDIDKQKLSELTKADFDNGRLALESEFYFDENSGIYAATDSEEGLLIDVEKLSADIMSVIDGLNQGQVTLKQTISEPEVSKEDLTDDVDRLNRLLSVPVSISTPVGNFSANNFTKQSWISFVQVGTDVEYSYNDSKIAAYAQGIVNTVDRAPQSQRVVQMDGEQRVITPGEDGFSTTNADEVSRALIEGFSSGRSTVAQLNADKLEPLSETVEGAEGRWMFSDLSLLTTYAYEGSELINSFPMSPGTPRFPTVVGTFEVWLKVRKQNMSGGVYGTPSYYFVGDVEWVAYFHGDYAFHGVWWHNEFGTGRRSRGCIGMSNEDAQWVYNFVEVGTPVIVVP